MRHAFHTLPWIHPPESPRILALYRARGRRVHLRRGSIAKGGAEAPRLFLLEQGLCAYFMNYGDLRPTLLSLIVPGRTIGDITCISGQPVNIVSKALRDATILELPPGLLVEAMRDDAELALAVTRSIIAKQESHLETLLKLTLPPADRLRVLLRALATSAGVPADGPWHRLQPRLNNAELALAVHTTRVTVSRAMSAWTGQGRVRKAGDALEVHDALFDGLYDWLEADGVAHGTSAAQASSAPRTAIAPAAPSAAASAPATRLPASGAPSTIAE